MSANLEDAIRTFYVNPSAEMAEFHRVRGREGFVENPYFLYAAMRAAPIVRSERFGGFWIFTTHRDVQYVYKHPELFSSFPNPIPAEAMGSVRPLIPVESDPPQHTAYRQLLAPMFAPREISRHESAIRAACNRLIDAFIDDGHCEFIESFARRLPPIVFTAMMGWPAEDAPLFLHWTDDIMNPTGTEEEIAAKRAAAGQAVYEYFGALIDERRTRPGDDILGRLLEARYEGSRPLTRFELLDTLFILMTAGLDTTKSVIGNAVAYLARHPEQQNRLAADPDRIPVAIEELIRWDSPVVAGRRVTRDFRYRGVQLRAEDRVMIITGAADRDPGVFERADDVDLGRFPNHHLGFGTGAHRCLGSHLARLELRIAFEVVHQRLVPYRIDPGGTVEHQVGWMRGVSRLPLRFGGGG
jgi:cytochrome P450